MNPTTVVDAGAPARDAGPSFGISDAARDSGTPPATVEEDAGDHADGGAEPPASGAITQCTIKASTNASDTLFYAGRYGCAVWIANSSNKLVKAFFVATKIASRTNLPAYKSASSGATVDVVAGATLTAPKQHQYTWTPGAAEAPGKYTLNVETHSSNGVQLATLPFDTAAPPVSESDSPGGEVPSLSVDCK